MRATRTLLPWAAALLIAGVFLDSLRFKFTGHPTPEHIFTTLRDWSGVELFYPLGPWIIGLSELVSAGLVLVLPLVLVLRGRAHTAQGLQWLGALIGIGVMSGAIVFHLFTPLGISTPVEWADGAPTAYSAALFGSACATWLACALILWMRRGAVPAWLPVVGRPAAAPTAL